MVVLLSFRRYSVGFFRRKPDQFDSGRGFFVLPNLRHSHSVVIAHSSSLLGAAERRLAAAQIQVVIDAPLRVMEVLPKIFRKYLTQH